MAAERKFRHERKSTAEAKEAKSGGRLRRYATLKSRKAIAMAMLDDAREDGGGRRFFLRKVVPECHPDRHRDNIGDSAVAESISKIANGILVSSRDIILVVKAFWY